MSPTVTKNEIVGALTVFRQSASKSFLKSNNKIQNGSEQKCKYHIVQNLFLQNTMSTDLEHTDRDLVHEFFSGRTDLRSNERDWKLILTDQEIDNVVESIAQVMNNMFYDKNVLLVCVLKGAAHFTVDLSRKLTIPYSIYYLTASSYHNGQTQSSVVLVDDLNPSKFVGKQVVVLDELYDNGTTLADVVSKLKSHAGVDAANITTCTLFKKNKKEDTRNSSCLDTWGITVPDCWLVGYGLDDQGEKRGWPHLFAVPKPSGSTLSDADKMVFASDQTSYLNLRRELHAESREMRGNARALFE